MTAVWRCGERDQPPEDYATEGEAMSRADELARWGKLAVVWAVDVPETHEDAAQGDASPSVGNYTDVTLEGPQIGNVT